MDTLFGPAIEPIDPLLEQLLRYKETGVIYGKRDLAARPGSKDGHTAWATGLVGGKVSYRALLAADPAGAQSVYPVAANRQ